MSRKIERLINLTIALLATKRYLTKSEIFRTVDGYVGSPESKERMFERDKDDLRTLGIEIEVGSFDPLFNDEAGYRIKVESYQLELGEITPIELSLLSLAAQSWQGATSNNAAQSAIQKLNSIGVPADAMDLPALTAKITSSFADISLITAAIAASDLLEFTYTSSNLVQQKRVVIPFSLASRAGYWYLACVDQEVQEIRTFRLDRIAGEITQKANLEAFTAPTNFDFAATLADNHTATFATIDVRKNKGHFLRMLATSSKDLGEWDQIRVPIFNLESLCSQVLWHGEDALVQEPAALRSLVIENLQALVNHHG